MPPEVLQAKLSEAESKWQAVAQQVASEAQLGAAQVNAVGETMRAELNAGTWYQRLWRPFLMFLWGATWPYQLYVVLATTDVTQRASILYALAAWNSMPAGIAGVYAWGRTKEKIADFLPAVPGGGLVSKVIKAVRGR